MFYRIFSKVLFLLPEEFSHHFVLCALKLLDKLCLLPKSRYQSSKPIKLLGLSFPNPVGLAAGFDKNADYIESLSTLGFGFLEVGTVTPKPQWGNKKPRLFRLSKDQALINRMGFNNKGVDYLVERLKKLNYEGIVGVNIGKNASTPIETAINDYRVCMEKVYNYASYITVNLSSPNTPGLRELQHGQYLNNLLATLKKQQKELAEKFGKYVPLLVKVAPDLVAEEIKDIASSLLTYDIDGLIVTNTSISREGLIQTERASEKGGLSGKPLGKISLHVQKQFYEYLQEDIPIVGVGGIMSADDACKKLQSGAKLIQIYTGLVYQGPKLVKDICKNVE